MVAQYDMASYKWENLISWERTIEGHMKKMWESFSDKLVTKAHMQKNYRRILLLLFLLNKILLVFLQCLLYVHDRKHHVTIYDFKYMSFLYSPFQFFTKF